MRYITGRMVECLLDATWKWKIDSRKISRKYRMPIPGASSKDPKDCFVCDDFKEIIKTDWSPTLPIPTGKKLDSPLRKDELGRHTWSFIHTASAYYSPASQASKDLMNSMINGIAAFYPCHYCAAHLTVYWGRVNCRGLSRRIHQNWIQRCFWVVGGVWYITM